MFGAVNQFGKVGRETHIPGGEHGDQFGIQGDMRNTLLSVIVGFCFWFTGCYACGTKQNPEQLKERTAQTTAQLKSDAKAVASGIREGWSRDKPLDVNHADRDDLASLPGITSAEADRIIANRPYDSPQALLTKRVIPSRDFDRIKDRITAK
jgi:helix-hairpin-helix protein